MVCAMLANIHRDPKKGKTYSPQDFMPGRKRKRQTSKEMKTNLLMWKKFYEIKNERAK
jgi:hypothetical protein